MSLKIENSRRDDESRVWAFRIVAGDTHTAKNFDSSKILLWPTMHPQKHG
jgi:hypothetical protein